MKVYATVNTNGRESLIVDKIKPLIYTMWQNDLLIGDNTDGLYDVLYHEKFSSGPKAFGGRELAFAMADGSVMTSDGWWWAGSVSRAEALMGINLGSVALRTVGGLVDSYVFTGYLMRPEIVEMLCEGVPKNLRNLDYWNVERACRTIKAQFVREQAVHSMEQDPDTLWKTVEAAIDDAAHNYKVSH